MQISMIGIDHSKAPLKYREKFSFTKQNAQKAAISLREGYRLSGCIFISTCNRTELWIATEEDEIHVSPKPSEMLADMLCSMRGIKKEDYIPYFTVRHSEEAVRHLFRLACGLDSRIFGEDQIISQVRDALNLGREVKTTGVELDRLFQTAIAVGKEVKTKVRLKTENQSSADNILRILKKEGLEIEGLKCLIIGNGKMGKLVANTLVNAGANVSMTLRRRIHKDDEHESIMPAGCTMIPYDERSEQLSKNQVVVSATLSPHYTVTKKQYLENLPENIHFYKENLNGKKIQYMFDLAVPRDIQESIGEEERVCLHDIDSLASPNEGVENDDALVKAERIIEAHLQEFDKWLEFRNFLPQINAIIDKLNEDIELRIRSSKSVCKLEEDELKDIVRLGGNAMESLVFETMKALPSDIAKEGLKAMEKASLKESLRH